MIWHWLLLFMRWFYHHIIVTLKFLRFWTVFCHFFFPSTAKEHTHRVIKIGKTLDNTSEMLLINNHCHRIYTLQLESNPQGSVTANKYFIILCTWLQSVKRIIACVLYVNFCRFVWKWHSLGPCNETLSIHRSYSIKLMHLHEFIVWRHQMTPTHKHSYYWFLSFWKITNKKRKKKL